MEADGTRYLEAILKTEPAGMQKHYCRAIYYYMQDGNPGTLKQGF